MNDFLDDKDMTAGEPYPKKTVKSKTPLLDNFGKDLTKAAAEGKIEQVIGREQEIDRVIQILSRKKKNNPVLVGEPGTGKTAIVEGIAMKIVDKKVSRILHNKRLVTLDLSLIVAGTKYRGQFEERMKQIMEELENNPEVIIFIDELHTIIGAGNSSGSLDASNMLKPALSRGAIQLIGATTIDEYKKSIEKDGAMERRFQKVMVEPPSVSQTKEILNNIKGIYESFHNVVYMPDAIEAAVKYADRYITNRNFPDKAIDIIDEVGSRVHIDNMMLPEHIIEIEKELSQLQLEKDLAVKLQKYESAAKFRDKERELVKRIEEAKIQWVEEEKLRKTPVTEEDVAKVVSKMINIPVTKMTEDEGTRLMRMSEVLKERVVGQDDAVEKVCEAIRRSKSGLASKTRPICSFLMLGSSGVGKTELCKTLAKYLFDDEKAFVRLDMGEYMEAHSVSRLIGSPPGYVGYEEGGQLTEKVRNKPYTIVLFDEIEKAHKNISNAMLQILDEGQLTDGLGRTINFKNTIIIMTSNLGTREVLEHKTVGFDTGISKELNVKAIINKALKKFFRPEFLNRIDEQVVFNKLSKENIVKIVDIHLANFEKLVKEQGYELEISPKVKSLIAEDGYSEEFGARPVLRAITTYVQNPASVKILLKEFVAGDTICIDYDEEKKETFAYKKGDKSVKKKK